MKRRTKMQATVKTENDADLERSVLGQLEWDPQIVSKDISVVIRDSIVTLTGFVHSYPEKLAAEKAAKAIYGVRAVANDIEVKPGNERTDPEIARDVVHAMRIDISVPDDRIKVGIHDGWVTLEGTVNWHFQRTGAERCARNADGVRGVMNKIQLKPSVSAADVKTKIENALRRSAEVDARRVSVWENEGTVHLYGSVRSYTEREEAEQAAWSAPGVLEVKDHITVQP
jgi:osmotically-inducible protein OsmY